MELFKDLKEKKILAWAFYDFSNSSYLLVFASFLLPVFFSTMLPDTGHSLGTWGLANAVATIFGLIMAIFVGKYSDKHSKFRSFKFSIILSFIGMVLISFSVQYAINLLFYFYIFTQSFFILSLSLSDSILPHVSNKKDSYEDSGFAWGFGYIGGIIALIIAIIIQKITGNEYNPFVFLSTAIFYLIFSFYSLKGLKEVQLNEIQTVKKNFILTKKQKNLLLLGYWFISEAITVILLFVTIYLTKEMGFSNLKVGLTLLAVQLVAFPATWYGGRLTKKFNPVLLLGVTIVFWGIALIFLIFNFGMIGLGFIVLFGSLALGNSQSYLRAQYSNIIEKSESGYQFGIYSIASEAAVFIGPVIYGVASDFLQSQRIPLVGLYLTMVLGYILIFRMTKGIKEEMSKV